MKYLPLFSVSAAMALVSCDSMNAPLTSSGSFDPLAPAGGVVRQTTSTTATFKPGQMVYATIDNTAFFNKRPKGDADADKLLTRDTRMKVISADFSYLKVELDSGEVGFVPSVMVGDPNAQAAALPPGVQVYPPYPGAVGSEPIPQLTPTDVPPGGVPPIIDPSAPAPLPTPAGAVPPNAPAGVTPATPQSTPLPPGIDEVTPSKPEEKKPVEGTPAPQ